MVHDIVQEAVIKTIPKKKKCKKAKWFSEEALEIAEKRREAKGKGEKERHNHMNAAFQRITKRDMKAFLSNLSKERKQQLKFKLLGCSLSQSLQIVSLSHLSKQL